MSIPLRGIGGGKETVLKNKVLKLEKKLSERFIWSGVAFVDEKLDIMEIPTLVFKGSVGEGYRKIGSMIGDTVVLINENMILD